MKKKIITITASPAVINAMGFVLIPVSTQRVLLASVYLKTLRETINICLS
jgi:hypothetical protein